MKGCLNECIFLKHSTVCTLHVRAFNLFVVTILHMSSVENNAPINVKPAGGRRGIGRDFDIFQKIAVKFPTPGQKCEVKYN